MDEPGLPLVYRGKVRDLYDAGDGRLLMVASDRLSAFDVVMAEPVPDKGRVLTAMSAFWFELLGDLAGNHLISTELDALPGAARDPGLAGRIMLVRRCEMLPVECIVRGYLAGTGWHEYREAGTVCGLPLPAGLREADQLPAPIFTPSTKAAVGIHDENISFDDVVERIGGPLAEAARDLALAVYERAAAHADARGILLADTKLELGLLDGRLVLADEVLTPDSSRFWPADPWQPGRAQPSYDTQYVRDWLTSPESGWDRRSEQPPPPLPQEVVDATRAKYVEAYERLTGTSWS